MPGVKPNLIHETIRNLCDDVRFWCTENCDLTRIEQAAIIHHRLVFIHPFANGNGRFSRLVSDRYLKAKKCSFPNWPTDLNHDGTYRKKYIQALKEADQGNFESLILYMLENGAKEY